MLLLWLLLQGTANADVQSSPETPRLRIVRKLTDASLPPSLFGKGWEGSKGIVVDDFEKLDKVSAEDKQALQQFDLLRQGKQLGMKGIADYSVVRTVLPFDTVTVRVLVFIDAKRASEWWNKKYETDEAKKQYKVVKDERFDAALDVVVSGELQVNKRIVRSDNVVITSHHLTKGDEHLKALEHIVKQLTTSKK